MKAAAVGGRRQILQLDIRTTHRNFAWRPCFLLQLSPRTAISSWLRAVPPQWIGKLANVCGTPSRGDRGTVYCSLGLERWARRSPPVRPDRNDTRLNPTHGH